MTRVAVLGPERSQQSVEDFYRGKQLDMVIGYSPGGTYDLYARLVARFLGNYIPGNPSVVHHIIVYLVPPGVTPSGQAGRLRTNWLGARKQSTHLR